MAKELLSTAETIKRDKYKFIKTRLCESKEVIKKNKIEFDNKKLIKYVIMRLFKSKKIIRTKKLTRIENGLIVVTVKKLRNLK